ncbi:hypothetical protein niasHT_006317 [Heterodera trifolii]|uniref:Replication factor A C-terminal domain-containing protein n=1 Tax=Heterodera trifolii TaxID=157864 RepID=A0ABD2JIZ2_9BILA
MLSRFQLKSTYKRDADGQFVNPKNVIDVKQFGGAGTFIVQANILNLQYKLYEACPTAAQNGHLCNRKLSDQRLCSSCGLVAKNPTDAILLRLELQDLMDKECRQNITMFTNSAQKYLGRKASEMRMMEQEGDGEGLARLLDSFIGKKIVAKIVIKEKDANWGGEGSSLHKFDWVVTSIFVPTTEAYAKDDGEQQKTEE